MVLLHQSRSVQQLLRMLEASINKEETTWKPRLYKAVTSQTTEVDSQLRNDTVAWLATLNVKFAFYPETLFATVAIFDRFLNSVKAHPKYIRCIGVSCIYIAAKANEEDEAVPSTLELVQKSECGCSVAEVLRMELCILDKLTWDVAMATPLDFLHIFHALLLSQYPLLLDGSARRVTPARQMHRLTCVLRACVQEHQLMTFPPSTLALAVVSLELERCCTAWLPATLALQALAQIGNKDLVWCRELVVQSLGGTHLAGYRLRPNRIRNRPTKRKVDEDDDDDDDIYDAIKRLYNEDTSQTDVLAMCRGDLANALPVATVAMAASAS